VDDWKFKVVSWEEMEADMRRCHTPEFLIQEERELFQRGISQIKISSAVENKYRKAEIRARNKIIMDNRARELGYKTWDEYCKVCLKIEAECEASGKPFSYDLVPNKPPLPLLEYNGQVLTYK